MKAWPDVCVVHIHGVCVYVSARVHVYVCMFVHFVHSKLVKGSEFLIYRINLYTHIYMHRKTFVYNVNNVMSEM